MKCRLRVNTIIDGKFIERGSLIDDSLLTERLKTDAYIAYDLEDTGGKAMVLRDLAFQSVPKPGADGIPTSYPVWVSAGELLDLAEVPESHRQSLKEGTDYKTAWTHEERAGVRRAEEDAYLKQFETEPAVPTKSRVRQA
jgi:hypothetical protein